MKDLMTNIVRVANELDKAGYGKEADILDGVLEKVAQTPIPPGYHMVGQPSQPGQPDPTQYTYMPQGHGNDTQYLPGQGQPAGYNPAVGGTGQWIYNPATGQWQQSRVNSVAPPVSQISNELSQTIQNVPTLVGEKEGAKAGKWLSKKLKLPTF